MSVVHNLSHLEYLAHKDLSANVLAFLASTGKINFAMHGLDYSLWKHPDYYYFVKSIKVTKKIIPLHSIKHYCSYRM